MGDLVPEYLFHYYEDSIGPFVSLSGLPVDEAERIFARIRADGRAFASKRPPDYLAIRRSLEKLVRELFIEKGGRPKTKHPYYMTLGPCPWLLDWYPNGRELKIPLSAFDHAAVSFTYGDTFPAMRYADGKPYRRKVFTLEELPRIIALYGLPQERNPDGALGPDRYIEAQVWDDAPIRQFADPRR